MRRSKWLSSFVLVFGVLYAQSPAATSADFFETKIRPLLANNCFSCHTQSELGGLRLDSDAAMKKGGKRGPAVIPGDADGSLLIKAVRHVDPAMKMPMGSKLKDAEVADLAEWVAAGAVWPSVEVPVKQGSSVEGKYVIRPEQRNFWSFQPLKAVPAPAVKDVKWARTEIDKFILARLEKEGLKPAKPANKRDLIRRATLDLTGLPPTWEETQAFEKDTSANALAKVVDRLLASPHYGERWGRMWLDVARYGEDDYRSLDPMRRGFNPYPNAFVYRDWVIQAMNDDLPYDQFIKAQIAGDLMDPASRHRTLPATGFLGLGPWYYDNGSTEVTRADERNDRVDVVTRSFLGLTVACARCHDHKYDPIPTTDYYSMAGVFLNTIYEEYPRAPKKVLDEYLKVEDEIDKKQKMLGEIQQHLSAQLSQSLAFHTSNYLQGVWEVTGTQKKEKSAVVEARKLDYELLDRWIAYMGRTTDKYKNKEAWQTMMKKPGNLPAAKRLADKFQEEVLSAMLTYNEMVDENKVIAAKALDGTKRKKRTNKPSNFVTNDDFCPGCGLRLKGLPEDQAAFWTEIFLRELKEADDPAAMMASGRMGNPGVLMFRGWGLESRTGSEAQAQMASFRNDITEARKKIETSYPFLHGVKDSETLSNLPVHLRGDPFQPGPEVARHFLSVLSTDTPRPFEKGSGRLELAESILKQPLAMRVIVNRVWKAHFDTGIVDTPSNFGVTGERPANPELLEYLAKYFADNGMSMKKLHREIMLSSVYRLSTADDAVAFAKDSGNRLYWRANRKRLDAEQLRDSVLAAAGNLDRALGGPSADLTPSLTRRTVYGKVSRYKLDQYLQLFDFPTPAISAEKRFTTTVPLQRLFLMNSDFMQLESEELAKRVAGEPDNRSRIRKIHLLAYNREPTEDEIKLGLDYLKSEPMTEYDERKKKKTDETAKPKDTEGAKPGVPTATDDAAQTGGAGADGMPPAEGAAAAAPMGMGMMGGVMPGARRGTGPPPPAEVKYEPTAWGRYAKVLLSSSEFLFVN